MLQFPSTSSSTGCLVSGDAGLRAAAAPAGNPYGALAVGIGMGIAAGLCGLGQGRATASASEALARNPGARPGIQLFLILGLAFIESLTLFTFVLLFIRTT